MTIELISERVKKLTKKYDETDPGKLAKAMGILVNYVPMGDYDGCCKGFMVTYHRISTSQSIVIWRKKYRRLSWPMSWAMRIYIAKRYKMQHFMMWLFLMIRT